MILKFLKISVNIISNLDLKSNTNKNKCNNAI